MISEWLEDGTDISRFRGVCRSWRSSVKPIPNKLSPLFPHPKPRSWYIINPNSYHQECESISKKSQIACAVYLFRPLNSNSNSKSSSSWIASVQESKPGNLLLLDTLTLDPIPSSLDLSDWSLTRIAISHFFHYRCPKKVSPFCFSVAAKTKVVFFPPAPVMACKSDSMALYQYNNTGSLYALKRCLTNFKTDDDAGQLVAAPCSSIDDFVNFNGRIYAVDVQSDVYVLDRTRLQTFVGLRWRFVSVFPHMYLAKACV